MPKPEWRNPNQTRMPNVECRMLVVTDMSVIRHSGFVIDSDFAIRVSAFIWANLCPSAA
jgi:hypothetical protein